MYSHQIRCGSAFTPTLLFTYPVYVVSTLLSLQGTEARQHIPKLSGN